MIRSRLGSGMSSVSGRLSGSSNCPSGSNARCLLGSGVRLIIKRSSRTPGHVNQSGHRKQCLPLDQRRVRSPNARAYNRVEHPRRYAAGRFIREADIYHVPPPTSCAGHYEISVKKRMIRIQNPHQRTETGIV